MWRYPLLALSFFWRLPIGIYPKEEGEIRYALAFLSLVGLLEGLIVSALGSLLLSVINPQVIALFVLLVLFFLRGIFHLDGLSDTFDALSYKGKGDPIADREKRLAIMKDPTVGVAGVSAVTTLLIAKFILFLEILSKNQPQLLVLPFFLSRFLLGFVLFLATPARKEGLGFLMITLFDRKILIFHVLISTILFLSYFLNNLYLLNSKQIFLFLCVNSIILIYFSLLFKRAFGGLTGDNLGALVEISELTTLICLAII